MKHLFFSLIMSFVALSLYAQNLHTLSTDRNAYRAADQLVKQQVEFKDPGSSGKNLNWDFSMVQPINEEYSLNYFIPDSTDMNRICGLEHNTRYYFRQIHDSLHAVGYENSTTYMEYVIPELRMHFPFEYGDTLFSYFQGTGQYCHRLKLAVKGYTRVQADAEGELKLPDETVKKALRVHTLRQYTQTGKDSIEMTLDTYSWYAAGIRYPVFESVKTIVSKKLHKLAGSDTENKLDTTVFTTSFYYPPEKQTTQIQTDPIPEQTDGYTSGAAAIFTEAQLMPNPVIDNLNINFKLTRAAKVWFSLHNNIGIPQSTTTPQNLDEGFHNNTINMSNMITGTYTLYVHVDDMVMREIVVKK